MILIEKSPTADSRTCDYSTVSKQQLLDSSHKHIDDIRKGFAFFIELMKKQAAIHDQSKLTHIDDFHRNFITGFKEKDWWEYHQSVERHHFNNPKYIPNDVNMVDILDQIIDGVMAGMARGGSYRQEPISPELLMQAYKNTVDLLLSQIKIVDYKKGEVNE